MKGNATRRAVVARAAQRLARWATTKIVSQVDYNAWASDYDATRRASASVASAILEALGPPQARLLLDIGGGTGNFAAVAREAGFRVAILDVGRTDFARPVHAWLNRYG